MCTMLTVHLFTYFIVVDHYIYIIIDIPPTMQAYKSIGQVQLSYNLGNKGVGKRFDAFFSFQHKQTYKKTMIATVLKFSPFKKHLNTLLNEILSDLHGVTLRLILSYKVKEFRNRISQNEAFIKFLYMECALCLQLLSLHISLQQTIIFI